MNWSLAHPLAVAAGGAVGALLRYAINTAFIRHGYGGLPSATLLVNVLGCLCTGFLLVWIDQRADPAFWRALLVTGVLGALTTFSALGLEVWQLVRAERWGWVALTLAAHVGLGVMAMAGGYNAGRALLNTSA